MIDVVPHAELAAHDIGHARAGPEWRTEPGRFGPAQQHAFQSSPPTLIQLRRPTWCRLGADAYLVKPGRLDEWVALVKSLGEDWLPGDQG
jgi:hypothetical protein